MKLSDTDRKLLVKFFQKQPVKKAFLFGSFARNEAGSESDIDLLVELDFAHPIGLHFVQMQLELEKLLKRKVDLVSEDAISKYVKPFVDKEKIIIYERAA